MFTIYSGSKHATSCLSYDVYAVNQVKFGEALVYRVKFGEALVYRVKFGEALGSLMYLLTKTFELIGFPTFI